jgi:protein phosphatase PTC2/3
MEKYGGCPGCVIAEPDVTVLNIEDETDFILLGSDGVFERLSNESIKRIV